MCSTATTEQTFLATKDAFGNTPLILAIKEGNLDKVNLLIENGADVNQDMKKTLFYAINEGNFDLVQILVKAGANLNIKDRHLNTPINLAVIQGNVDIVKYLLEAGASLRLMNVSGVTPLSIATVCSNLELVKLLIEKGADINEKETDGNTALNFISKFVDVEIYKLLIEAGANVNNREKNGQTPLIYAAIAEVPKIVKLLIDAGADINAKDSYGWSPISVSIMGRNFEIINILIQNIIANPSTTKPRCVLHNARASQFWDDCIDELGKLKTGMLGDSRFSLYKFLLERNLDKLLEYMSNESLLKDSTLLNYQKEFPAYFSMIVDQVTKGRQREILLYNCNLVMAHCDLEVLPPKICAMITNDITNSDLKSFIESALVATNHDD